MTFYNDELWNPCSMERGVKRKQNITNTYIYKIWLSLIHVSILPKISIDKCAHKHICQVAGNMFLIGEPRYYCGMQVQNQTYL